MRRSLMLVILLLGSAGSARADSKAILDIDQCLDSARRDHNNGCKDKCMEFSRDQLGSCLDACMNSMPDELLARCVEQSAGEQDILRLCGMSKDDPVGFRDYVQTNSFRVSPDLVRSAIDAECSKVAGNAAAKQELDEKRQALLAKEAQLKQDLSEALNDNADRSAKAEAAKDEFEKRNGWAKQACLKNGYCDRIMNMGSDPKAHINDPDATQHDVMMWKDAEARYRNVQATQWAVQKTGKLYKAIDNEPLLLLGASCFRAKGAEIRDESGQIKDSALAGSDSVLDAYNSLGQRLESAVDVSKKASGELDDFLSKWHVQLDSSKIEQAASNYDRGGDDDFDFKKGGIAEVADKCPTVMNTSVSQ